MFFQTTGSFIILEYLYEVANNFLFWSHFFQAGFLALHYWHFRLHNSLLWGCGVCSVWICTSILLRTVQFKSRPSKTILLINLVELLPSERICWPACLPSEGKYHARIVFSVVFLWVNHWHSMKKKLHNLHLKIKWLLLKDIITYVLFVNLGLIFLLAKTWRKLLKQFQYMRLWLLQEAYPAMLHNFIIYYHLLKAKRAKCQVLHKSLSDKRPLKWTAWNFSTSLSPISLTIIAKCIHHSQTTAAHFIIKSQYHKKEQGKV